MPLLRVKTGAKNEKTFILDGGPRRKKPLRFKAVNLVEILTLEGSEFDNFRER